MDEAVHVMVEIAQQFDLTRRLLELGNQIVALAQDVSATDVGKDGLDESRNPSVFAFSESESSVRASASGNSPVSAARTPRPSLPDPRLVRKIIRQRELRFQIFDNGLFADPAWDILLDLTAARAEHKRVSVTSLCIASGVPATTALRWIQILLDAGLLLRCEDDRDRRRAFVSLSDYGADLVARYFFQLDSNNEFLL